MRVGDNCQLEVDNEASIPMIWYVDDYVEQPVKHAFFRRAGIGTTGMLSSADREQLGECLQRTQQQSRRRRKR